MCQMFANCPMSTKYPPCGRLSCLALTDTAPLWSGPQLRHAATCAALVIFPSRHLEESSSASTTSVAVLTCILSTIWLKKLCRIDLLTYPGKISKLGRTEVGSLADKNPHFASVLVLFSA